MDADKVKAAVFDPDFWKNGCNDSPAFAFDQYTQLFHMSFKDAGSLSPYGHKSSSFFHRQCLRESRERIEKRTIKEVQLGAACDDVDDMLELGVRLASAVHISYDDEAAIMWCKKVVGGNFPQQKQAIAASLICAILRRNAAAKGDDNLKDNLEIFVWAEISAMHGLLSHGCFRLARAYEGRFEDVDKPGSPFAKYTHLWKAYYDYCDAEGLQPLDMRRCSACKIRPKHRRTLKRCAGDCPKDKKTTYCSVKCQREDWPKHRVWCKLEVVETDSEWTSDSEREDWEYSDDEIEDLPQPLPRTGR